jgi:hypothetical protein
MISKKGSTALLAVLSVGLFVVVSLSALYVADDSSEGVPDNAGEQFTIDINSYFTAATGSSDAVKAIWTSPSDPITIKINGDIKNLSLPYGYSLIDLINNYTTIKVDTHYVKLDGSLGADAPSVIYDFIDQVIPALEGAVATGGIDIIGIYSNTLGLVRAGLDNYDGSIQVSIETGPAALTSTQDLLKAVSISATTTKITVTVNIAEGALPNLVGSLTVLEFIDALSTKTTAELFGVAIAPNVDAFADRLLDTVPATLTSASQKVSYVWDLDRKLSVTNLLKSDAGGNTGLSGLLTAIYAKADTTPASGSNGWAVLMGTLGSDGTYTLDGGLNIKLGSQSIFLPTEIVLTKVVKEPLSGVSLKPDVEFKYTGGPFTVAVGDLILPAGLAGSEIDTIVVTSGSWNAGTEATIIVTVKTDAFNYTGSQNIPYIIKKADLPAVTIDTSGLTKAYDGSPISAPTIADLIGLPTDGAGSVTFEYVYSTSSDTPGIHSTPPTDAATDHSVKAYIAEGVNYLEGESAPANITINKATPVLSGVSATEVVIGDTDTDVTVTGTATIAGGSISVAGTWALVGPVNFTSAGTGSYLFVFTPDNTRDFDSVTDNVSVTVKLFASIVNPVYDNSATIFVVYGATYSDTSLPGITTTGDTAGVIHWVPYTTDPITADGPIYFHWEFVPTDPDYTVVFGSVEFQFETIKLDHIEVTNSVASYIYGVTSTDIFSTITTTAYYNYGPSQVVPGSYIAPPTLTAGNVDITVSYTQYGTGITKNATITVTIAKADPIVNPVVASTTIYEWEDFPLISLDSFSTPGTIAWIEPIPVTIGINSYGWKFTPTDTANYNVVESTSNVTVDQDPPVSIDILTPPSKTSYITGETFNRAGLVVEVTFASTSTRIVTNYEVNPTVLSGGDTFVTISYTTGVSPDVVETTLDVSVTDYVTIRYDANGGSWTSGQPSNLVVVPYTNINVQFSTLPTKAGYEFRGWSTLSDYGTAPQYTATGVKSFVAVSNTTLYASWIVSADDGTGTGGSHGGSGGTGTGGGSTGTGGGSTGTGSGDSDNGQSYWWIILLIVIILVITAIIAFWRIRN